jgi:hypothetical protein
MYDWDLLMGDNSRVILKVTINHNPAKTDECQPNFPKARANHAYPTQPAATH